MEKELTAREYLQNLLTDGLMFKDIPNDMLIWMLGDGGGSLTAQLFFELEQEYIRRLRGVDDGR